MGGDAGDFSRRPGREDARRERARAREGRENVSYGRRRRPRRYDVVHFLSSGRIRVLGVYSPVNR